jgi:regulatory protein
VTRFTKPRRPRPPLDQQKLQELALTYVGRFATTKAKLGAYLTRKLRERGWDGSSDPDVDGIAERFVSQGYVDDAAYALSKSRSLSGRGYGPARVDRSLRVAGISDSDGEAARELADGEAIEAALRFAARRRIGPYADSAPDPKARDRALSAMVRAGHRFALARAVLDIPPHPAADADDLAEQLRTKVG